MNESKWTRLDRETIPTSLAYTTIWAVPLELVVVFIVAGIMRPLSSGVEVSSASMLVVMVLLAMIIAFGSCAIVSLVSTWKALKWRQGVPLAHSTSLPANAHSILRDAETEHGSSYSFYQVTLFTPHPSKLDKLEEIARDIEQMNVMGLENIQAQPAHLSESLLSRPKDGILVSFSAPDYSDRVELAKIIKDRGNKESLTCTGFFSEAHARRIPESMLPLSDKED